MRVGVFSSVAGLVTLASLFVGVMTVPPSQWASNLGAWARVLTAFAWLVWPAAIALLCGSVGLLCGRYLIPHGHPQVVRHNIERENTFSDRLQILAKNELVQSIDVLSYTAETLQDILTYDFRNQAGITFRLMTRNWQDEEHDEREYNVLLANSGRRRWDKASAIRSYAEAPWTYLGNRSQRFYTGLHPLTKLMLVKYNRKVLGFLSFYDFQEWPDTGGSPFKGSTSLGYVLDSDDPFDAEMLERLQHQFDFIWQYRSVAIEAVGHTIYKSVFASPKVKHHTD